MSAVKIFVWWFVIGCAVALSVIMLQGGIREVLQAQGPLWEAKLTEILTAIVGGGMLAGCVALILNRIKKSD